MTPFDSELRPPEDFSYYLATKEPLLIVGGQAVNLWEFKRHPHKFLKTLDRGLHGEQKGT